MSAPAGGVVTTFAEGVLTATTVDALPSTTGGLIATVVANSAATSLVTMVLRTKAAPLCTVLATTGLVTGEVAATLTAVAAGNMETTATARLVDSTFAGVFLGLESIATGPLAPATTAPGRPTVIGFAETALLVPPPDKPEAKLFKGIAELLPLPSPPPPPQAVIKIDSSAAIIAVGLQIFLYEMIEAICLNFINSS